MANGSKRQSKYSVTFWQMFAIIVIAAVLGGIIANYSYNNQIYDEVNSISFTPKAATEKAPVKKAPLRR